MNYMAEYTTGETTECVNYDYDSDDTACVLSSVNNGMLYYIV